MSPKLASEGPIARTNTCRGVCPEITKPLVSASSPPVTRASIEILLIAAPELAMADALKM